MQPLETQRVRANNDLLMHIQVAGLMIVDVHFQVTVFIFGGGCYNKGISLSDCVVFFFLFRVLELIWVIISLALL
jgi:hypothetical protein